MSLNPFRNLKAANKRFMEFVDARAFDKAMSVLKSGIDLQDKHKVMNNYSGPMFYVVERGDDQQGCIKLLQEMFRQGGNPAQLDLPNYRQQSMIHHAIRRQMIDVARFIHESGCPVNIADSEGVTPLMTAIANRNMNAYGWLLQLGVLDSMSTNERNTLLPLAVKSGFKIAGLEPILKAGAACNGDYEGLNAAHYAVHQNDPEVFSWLLQAGVPVRAWDVDGRSCVHRAVSEDARDILRLILSQDPEEWCVKCSRGMTPLEYAVDYGREEMVDILRAHATEQGVDTEPLLDGLLLRAAAAGRAAMVSYLVSKGANINAVDENGATALIIAMKKEHKDVAKAILSIDAVDVQVTDNSGNGAFHYAAGDMRDLLEPLKDPEEEKTRQLNALREKGPHETYSRSGDYSIDLKDGGGLTYTFNFALQQVIIRDMVKGAVMAQDFAEVPRQEAIAEAFGKLVEQGGTPPAYEARARLHKNAPKEGI